MASDPFFLHALPVQTCTLRPDCAKVGAEGLGNSATGEEVLAAGATCTVEGVESAGPGVLATGASASDSDEEDKVVSCSEVLTSSAISCSCC